MSRISVGKKEFPFLGIQGRKEGMVRDKRLGVPSILGR